MTAVDQDKNLILRVKEDMDNVEPSASSVAALNLLRLSQYTDRKDFQDMAEKTLKSFGTTMKESPRAMPQMLVALDFALTEPRQIVIAGKPGAADTEAAAQNAASSTFIPVKTVVLAGPDACPSQKPLDGKAAAYVCVRHTCKQPTSDPQLFNQLLNAF